MHRRFLALTLVALASFSAAAHAHDGAAPHSKMIGQMIGQTILAKLDGKGETGQPCHATYRDKAVDKGTYDTVNNELACHDSHEWILCQKDDTSDGPDKPLCVDGYKD